MFEKLDVGVRHPFCTWTLYLGWQSPTCLSEWPLPVSKRRLDTWMNKIVCECLSFSYPYPLVPTLSGCVTGPLYEKAYFQPPRKYLLV